MTILLLKKTNVSQVDEYAGVLAGFGKVGKEHGDTEYEQRFILRHIAEQLRRKITFCLAN